MVKRRLDKVGLGDACLELHSHNTKKKALLDELRRTLELGRPREKEVPGERARLAQNRDRLNDYCDAVNSPIGSTGVTPYEALGEVVRLKQETGADALQRLTIPEMSSWDGAAFRRFESLVAELDEWLAAWGTPNKHPFWGSARETFLPTEEDTLRSRIDDALQSINELVGSGARLAASLGAEAPVRLVDIQTMLPPSWQFWRNWFGKDRIPRKELQDAIASHFDRLKQVTSFINLDEHVFLGQDAALVAEPFEEQREALIEWRNTAPQLQSLAEFNTLADRCVEAGLESIVAVAQIWSAPARSLSRYFRYTWFAGLLERAYAERKSLSGFNRTEP